MPLLEMGRILKNKLSPLRVNSYCVASLSPSLLQSFMQTSDSSFIPEAIGNERTSTYIFGKRIADYHTAARIRF